MTFLTTLFAFIIAIGILVTVHEFGHFWVAKKLGIKVLRFSIGFGKILKSWQLGETEYTLCLLPFGGFVKMLDENQAAVEPQERHLAFNRQSVYARIAVVAAGPAANFILAIILYTIFFMIGTNGVKPVVGLVKNGSIAEQSGLQSGDQFISINRQKTPSIGEFSINFLQAAQYPTVQMEVQSKNTDLKDLVFILKTDFFANPQQGIGQYLGFEFALPKLTPIINQVVENSPASNAGIQTHDKIITANGAPIKTWVEFVKVIKNNPNKPIQLQIMRNDHLVELSLTPENKNSTAKAGVSVMIPNDYLDEWQVFVRKNPIDAFLSANMRVYQLSLLNLKIIKKMLLGETSIKQITGPIGIADYAGRNLRASLSAFLAFLALLSIGLGLLNLLPIPILDGGHLLLYLLELLKGTPVNQVSQRILMGIGLFVILSLTFVAVYNDLSRLLQGS